MKVDRVEAFVNSFGNDPCELILKPESTLAKKIGEQKIAVTRIQHPLNIKFEIVEEVIGNTTVKHSEQSNIAINFSEVQKRLYKISDEYAQSLITDGIPIEDIIDAHIMIILPR